jgi:non-homologous end joining protein Ku
LAIEAWGKGMLGTTLRYDYEVRDEKTFFKDIDPHAWGEAQGSFV